MDQGRSGRRHDSRSVSTIFAQRKPNGGERRAGEKLKVPAKGDYYGLSGCAYYDAHDRSLRLHHRAVAAWR